MLQISQNLTVSYLILLHSLAWPGLATNLWAKRSIYNWKHAPLRALKVQRRKVANQFHRFPSKHVKEYRIS